jgi:hypothetical protein
MSDQPELPNLTPLIVEFQRLGNRLIEAGEPVENVWEAAFTCSVVGKLAWQGPRRTAEECAMTSGFLARAAEAKEAAGRQSDTKH